MPFAPKDIADWTDFHYRFYQLVELAVGNRRELTKEEAESNEALARIEEKIDTGGEWLKELDSYFGTPDFGDMFEDTSLLEKLDEELTRQSEEF